MHFHAQTILLLLQTTTLTLTLASPNPAPTPEPQIPAVGPTPTLAATQSPTVTLVLGGWTLGATPRGVKGGLMGVKGGVKMEKGEDEKRDGEGEGGKEKRQGRFGPYPKGYPPQRDPNVIVWLEENNKKTSAKNGKRDLPGYYGFWFPKIGGSGNRKGGDENGGVKEKRDTPDADNSLVIPSRTKWPGSGSVGGMGRRWMRIE